MRCQNKILIRWTPDFSYAIGLLTTDGNLSKDGRHLELTSKDKELIVTFRRCLNIKNKIGYKARGGSKTKKYLRVQFGDKNFYQFLISLGLTPAKSRTIRSISIPHGYFADFLRGCIDGDGNISIVRHPESRHPQLRLRLASASQPFLEWIKEEISVHLKITGGWIYQEPRACLTLTYAKDDSIKLLHFIYYYGVRSYLKRKLIIAKPFLRV